MAKPWDNDEDGTPASAPTNPTEVITAEGKTKKVWDKDPDYEDKKQTDKPRRDMSIWDTAKASARIVGHGIPIAGQFIENTPDSQQIYREHPYASFGLNAAGAVGSMAIPGMWAGRAASLGGQMARGAGVGGLFGGADSAAAGNSGDQVAKDTVSGGIFGMGSPVLAKLISPKAVPKTAAEIRGMAHKTGPFSSTFKDPAVVKSKIDPKTGKSTDMGEFTAAHNAAKKANKAAPGLMETLRQTTRPERTVGLGALGMLSGAHPALTAAMASLPYSVPIAKWAGNKAANASWANKPMSKIPALGKYNPTKADIVRALIMGGAGNITQKEQPVD